MLSIASSARDKTTKLWMTVSSWDIILDDYVSPVMLQGHALFTRQAGSDLPCPPLDFTGGFNKFFGAAFNLTGSDTIESKYGVPFGELSEDSVTHY